MNTVSQDQGKKWRVWGRIIGPELPSFSIRLGRAIVGPWPLSSVPPAAPSGLQVTDTRGVPYAQNNAPHTRIQSDCWVVVDGIDAQDYDSAIRQFSQRDIPPIVVALSTASSHPPVRVEIVGADDYNEPFVWSPIMAVTMYSPIIDVTDERSADLARKVAIIDSNENLRTAAEVFRRSIIYSDMTADSLSASSAILSAYQVLELCARIIQMEKPENYDEKVSEISRKLQARLSAKTSMTKRAAAIKSAAQALDQLEGKHISLRIECAAEVFGLDKNWIERERRLGKIRNSRIAHPGATPSIFELGMALGADDKSADYEAISIASEMLWHAIRYIDEQGEQP